MKKHLKFVVFLVLLSSCSNQYIQVFSTQSNILNSENNFYFENDTVKISYDFWARRGVMSFAIFNKLAKPIYIDWKSSSFIINNMKLNYWLDETQTNTSASYGGYFYNGPPLQFDFGISGGAQSSVSASVKPERITFIPPHSYVFRSQFYIVPQNGYTIVTAHRDIEARNDDTSKATKVYETRFNSETAPIKFRNFIAIKFEENLQEFTFIDNEFYLSSVKEMDVRHFQGRAYYDVKGNLIYPDLFRSGKSFYLKIPTEESFEVRNRLE